jgi:hypothetical protein
MHKKTNWKSYKNSCQKTGLEYTKTREFAAVGCRQCNKATNTTDSKRQQMPEV